MNFTWGRIGKLAAAVVLAILTGWFVAFWRWWHFGPSQKILGATVKWSELLYAMGEPADEEAKARRAAESRRRAVESLMSNAQRGASSDFLGGEEGVTWAKRIRGRIANLAVCRCWC